MSNPFNISFEIPPLPNLDLFNGDGNNAESDTKEFNFFTFLKPKNVMQKSDQNNMSPPRSLRIVRPKESQSSPSNRRQSKIEHKQHIKDKTPSSIWNLMPLVNEGLLDHNLKSESGIQRLWEDEHLDIQLRDMNISECGLLTSQKAAYFTTEFNLASNSILQLEPKNCYKEKTLVHQALLMLQGIPGQIFQLEEKTFVFQLINDIEIQGYSLTDEAMASTFEPLMEAGCYFLHLKEFSEYFQSTNSQKNHGMVIQRFVIAVQNFLTFYQNQVNELWSQVERRRADENLRILKSTTPLTKEMTILELVVHMSSLSRQIKLLAGVCLTQNFIENRTNDMREDNLNLKRITYDKKSLLQAFPIDIANVQQNQWQQQFPVGAQLLTYLYKILLCCDSFSDLQTSDLLRQLFQESVEPFLQMINSFIFTGDFDDPHSEFFIKKIYRKRQDNEGNTDMSQDFIFMLDSHLTVPVFLMDIAPIIFKAGSSLHLIKRQDIQKEFAHSKESLRQYLDICSLNKTIPGHMLSLEFQIGKLKQVHDERSLHFDSKIEHLQQMEIAIFHHEQEILYSQLKARENAKQEYMRQWEEKEQIRKDKEKQRKLAFMKDIQSQIDLAHQRKIAIQLQKDAEKEAYRKDLQEYEKRRDGVKEELKRQYEQILIDNQRVTDVRSEEVKNDEQNEQQYLQAIQDHNTTIDNNNDSMELVVFESPVEMSTSVEIIKIEEKNINIESIKIVEDLLQKTILSKVFERIDEVKQIETKRKTWNKIRKDERFKEVIEKRNKWNYQEPQVPIRTKLNSIFDQFELSVVVDEQNTHIEAQTYKVPLSLALNQCVVSVVTEQCKLINKCLIHMIFRRLRLLQHLEALRHFYFFFQGDVLSLFMQSIFNNDAESTTKENSLAFVNSQFEVAIKTTLPVNTRTIFDEQDFQKVFGFTSYLQENFQFQVGNNFRADLVSPNFYFTAFNIGDYLKLTYKRKYPLDMVISDQCIEKYNSVFFFLLKLKRASQILSSLWKYLNTIEFRRLPDIKQHKIRRFYVLRTKMQHFISVLEQYTLIDVIQGSWVIFKQNLAHQTVFEDLIKLHNEYLDSIKHQSVDIIDIQQPISMILQFNLLIKQNGTSIAGDEGRSAYSRIKEVESQFEGYTQVFYKIVKNLSQKSDSTGLSSLKKLHTLLDFNNFYDGK